MLPKNSSSLRDDQFKENKERNLENLLQSLSEDKRSSFPIPEKNASKERKTFRIESSVLSRLQTFLPQLAASNAQLKRENSVEDSNFDYQIEEVNSEHEVESDDAIEENQGQTLIEPEFFEPYIEMNLNLGVFDVPKDHKTIDTLAALCESPYKQTESFTDEPHVKMPPTIEEL